MRVGSALIQSEMGKCATNSLDFNAEHRTCLLRRLHSKKALGVPVSDPLFVGRADRKSFQEGASFRYREKGIVSGEQDSIGSNLQQ